MKLDIKFDTRQIERQLTDLQRNQIPFATALTLTRLGQRIDEGLKGAMRTGFDRPTPYTLRSTFIRPATKRRLEVTVGLKDRPFGGNRLSSAEILGHHFDGGIREPKALELWLRRAGYLGASEYVVPGAGARLDRYGNMSRGQIQQILSQLKAGPDASAYASSSARSRRNVQRAGVIFWSRGGRLARGAWQRVGKYRLRPLLIAIAAPSYRKRIDLERIARQAVSRYGQLEFDRALRQAIRGGR